MIFLKPISLYKIRLSFNRSSLHPAPGIGQIIEIGVESSQCDIASILCDLIDRHPAYQGYSFVLFQQLTQRRNLMKRRTFVKGASAATLLTTATMMSNNNLMASNSSPSLNSGPFHYKKTLETTRQMPGFSLNFIATGEHTNGAFALLEGRARKGGEPPMHTHEHEDEAFYMLSGEMIVTIGEEDFHIKPGDFIFLPRLIPHTQKFLTETVHVLLMISPAGLEEYFYTLSAPAENFGIPPLPTAPPPTEMMQMMAKLDQQFGISYPG